jgi:hypothetical protein
MMMNRSIPAALCAAVALAWAPARAAQAGQPGYYFPPKLLTRGAASSPVAGPGSVVVQVFVKTDGSFDVQKVLRSTNHGDDAAALEIARRSTYRPAKRGAAPEAAFYSFTLKFSGTSVAVDDSLPAVKPGSGVAKFVGLIRARKYAAAKSGLNDYLGAHPDDREAWLALGLANAYLSDWLPSAAAFDKGGAIPAKYQAVAASAYAQAAQAQFKSAPANAVADARRAVTLQPSAATYNTLGSAETGAGDYAAGAADLEKAKALASALPPKDRAQIAANLVYAYAGAGDGERAKAALADVNTGDPAVKTAAQSVVAGYYAKQADGAAKAGKPGDAAALFEQAAQVAPSLAVAMYANAALVYLNAKPKPDAAKAKVEADKALLLDAGDARANFAAGVALADDGKSKDALPYLNKADAGAKAANDAALAASVENVIKQLGGAK